MKKFKIEGNSLVSRIEELNITSVTINTVAKTASASFLHSLQSKYPTIHHGHSLIHLRNVIEKCEDTLIISGIRNPLERNVSYFFQTLSDNFHNDVKILENEYKGEYCFVMTKEEMLEASPLQLIVAFRNQKYHTSFNKWFYEFFDITKLLDVEFDKENGIKIYSLPNNNHLLLYTFEKLRRNELFLRSFFGINEFSHSNNAAQRYYSEKYSAFKRLLTLSPEYKIKLLRTPIMKYFYTDDEIESFFNRF